MTNAQLRRRLKEIRGDDTQRAISGKLGVDPATWHRAEKYGIVGPGLKLALIQNLGIDLDSE